MSDFQGGDVPIQCTFRYGLLGVRIRSDGHNTVPGYIPAFHMIRSKILTFPAKFVNVVQYDSSFGLTFPKTIAEPSPQLSRCKYP